MAAVRSPGRDRTRSPAAPPTAPRTAPTTTWAAAPTGATGLRAVAGGVALVVVVAGLHALDHPALAPPSLGRPATWGDWAESAGPVRACVALVRLGALAVGWYLLLAVALEVVARSRPGRMADAAADLVTALGAQDLVVALVGGGLLASTGLASGSPVAATAAAAGDAVIPGPGTAPIDPAGGLDRPDDPLDPGSPSSAPGPDQEAPRLARLDRPGAERPTTQPAPEAGSTPPRLRRLADPAPEAPPADADRAAVSEPGSTPPRLRRLADPLAAATPVEVATATMPDHDPAGPDDGGDQDATGAGGDPDGPGRGDEHTAWKVAPGQHFWSIATERVAADLGRTPNDAEVGPYWARLVAANRDRLVDPGNPDLLLPGQVLRCPPTGSRAIGPGGAT